LTLQGLDLARAGAKHYHEVMNKKHSNPLAGIDLVLAPLAGITDSVFREICRSYGADMTVTEMISAEGIMRHPHRLRAIRNLDACDHPLAIQLFGSDPDVMGCAAAVLSRWGPRFIDLNFGCPVKKVISSNSGAAVLKDPGRLKDICANVVNRSGVPVSIKIRSAWSGTDSRRLELIGRASAETGVSCITLHARSREQAFRGRADWELIRILKESTAVPVVGNGDVKSADDYFEMKTLTGCDAVMIGRAAIGNPWIFAEIKNRLHNKRHAPPSVRERIGALLSHLERTVEAVGEPMGLITSRKISAAYVKYLPNARKLRSRLMQCTRLSQARECAADYLALQNAVVLSSGIRRAVQ